MSGIVQILMASLFFSRHLFTIRHRGEMHCIVLKKQKQKETDSSPFWSQFIGISVPFLKKWDVRQCGPKRKGKEWCRQGEQKCLGWLGEALQGDKTNCFKDTADRNEAINYYNKCPLLVILPHFLVIIIIHSVITHAGVTLAEGPASRECYKCSEDEVGGYEDLKK